MARASVRKGTAANVGTTHLVATAEVSESSETREIQRIAINDEAGNEITVASAAEVDPVDVTLTSANTNYVLSAAGFRRGFVIYNGSDTDVMMGFSTNLGGSGKTGIKIYSGGYYSQGPGIGVYTGNVYARCTSAGKIVAVQIW